MIFNPQPLRVGPPSLANAPKAFVLFFSWFVAISQSTGGGTGTLDHGAAAASAHEGFVVVPNPTNAVQFLLYTDASPNASHLFNTFAIQAYGETLLKSLGSSDWGGGPSLLPPDVSLHNLLINGAGPDLASKNGMSVAGEASGPDWYYIALDGSAAYHAQLKEFKRGILFIEPDLFILYDHMVARELSGFQMLLHPPVFTQVDNVWGDLRLHSPKAVLRIHAPSGRKMFRRWERTESASDKILPDTLTVRLGPTNKLAEFNCLTVFAINRANDPQELAFKLIESNHAIGARIHRNGLPVLAAFKTDQSLETSSLTGFVFSGPVGVSVFKPKVRP
jgi:hypothetical protein